MRVAGFSSETWWTWSSRRLRPIKSLTDSCRLDFVFTFIYALNINTYWRWRKTRPHAIAATSDVRTISERHPELATTTWNTTHFSSASSCFFLTWPDSYFFCRNSILDENNKARENKQEYKIKINTNLALNLALVPAAFSQCNGENGTGCLPVSVSLCECVYVSYACVCVCVSAVCEYAPTSEWCACR